MKLSIFSSLLASATLVHADPVQLIVDTDLGFDVDDVGALAVAHHLADIGACELLGVIHNTGFYKGIGGVDVVNNYYGRATSVGLGAYKGAWGSSTDAQQAQDSYTSKIEGDFPSPVQNYDQVPNEVDAYRALLEQSINGTVVIASIGEPTALRNLLEAEPALFASKVKEIHYMDGGYNFGCGDSAGSGWSPWLGSTQDCDGAAQYVMEHVPSTVAQYFSLNGGDQEAGGRFQDGCGQGPVKEAYQTWTNFGTRPSWDLISVYLAVLGPGSLWSTAYAGTDYVDYYGNENFDNSNTSNNEYQVWVDGAHSGDVVYTLTFGGCAGYGLYSGRNCYGGGHGAGTDLDGDTPVASSTTLADCQARCDAADGCDAVVVVNTNDGLVDCYRKGSVTIADCDDGAWAFDTYLSKNATAV